MKLWKTITSLFESEQPEVLAEAPDGINRIVKLLKDGKRHYVSVDDVAIECSSLAQAQAEYEFRINDQNRNL